MNFSNLFGSNRQKKLTHSDKLHARFSSCGYHKTPFSNSFCYDKTYVNSVVVYSVTIFILFGLHTMVPPAEFIVGKFFTQS